jgi:cation-transporting ATPase E
MGSGAAATRGVAQVVLLDDSFATLPSVVAEGRRVIGNIERVANFFLTKTMYSILLALFVAVAQVTFPFIPIHISLVGWFTIGIPASVLALAPNAERARHGFLSRVLHFGIPAGVIVAATVFCSYLLVLPPVGSPPQASVQAATAALVTLLMAGTWVMVVNSRPYAWWKLAMIVCCMAASLTVYLLPLGQQFFSLDISNTPMMTSGFLMGGLAVLLIESLWWIVGLLSKEPRKFWA